MPLRLRDRRWYPVVFLVGSIGVIVVWFQFPAGLRSGLLVPAIGIVAGFVYFLYRQHLDETKLFKQLFTEFNKRYDLLNEPLNRILGAPDEAGLSTSEKDCLFSYFNLCAEEFVFYNAGYIDRYVWYSWNQGMKQFFRNPRIKALWKEECRADSYYGFQAPC
jgi:hypothetical protein